MVKISFILEIKSVLKKLWQVVYKQLKIQTSDANKSVFKREKPFLLCQSFFPIKQFDALKHTVDTIK